jgi:molecular chaperone GrpE
MVCKTTPEMSSREESMSEEDNKVEENTSANEEAATAPKGPSPEEQIASLKDQHLRALAEVENIRRRSIKEREETAQFAVSNFAREILAVADNFRRALDAVPSDEGQNDTFKHLKTGVEATERQLLSVLEKFGIKPLNPMGLPFDPNFHRVMMEVEDPSKPVGTVVQVLQAGYMIQDRLLREALVAVSKGGVVPHKVDTSA